MALCRNTLEVWAYGIKGKLFTSGLIVWLDFLNHQIVVVWVNDEWVVGTHLARFKYSTHAHTSAQL